MKKINVVLKYNDFNYKEYFLMNDKELKNTLSSINKCRIEKFNINYKVIEVIKFDNNNIINIYEKLIRDYKIKVVTFTSFLINFKYVTQINNKNLISLNKLQIKYK